MTILLLLLSYKLCSRFNTSSQLFLYRVNFLIKFRGYYKLMTKTQKLEIGLTNIINSMKAKNIQLCAAVRLTAYKSESENRKDFVLDCLNTIQYRKLSCLTYRSTLLKSNILMTLNKVNRCTMMFFL